MSSQFRARIRLSSESRSSTRFLGPSLLVHNPEFHPLGNLVQWGLQRVCDLPQSPHGRVDDPSLDPADVRSVEAALAAEALLRVARPLTEFSHDGPDGSHFQIGRLDLLLAPLHQQIRWCYVEAYQPTAYTPHLRRRGWCPSAAEIGAECRQIPVGCCILENRVDKPLLPLANGGCGGARVSSARPSF